MSCNCERKPVAETCSCIEHWMKCTNVCTLTNCENFCKDKNKMLKEEFNEYGDSWDDRKK